MHKISSRRTLLQAAGGLAGILASGRAPVFAQAVPKKMQIAAVNPVPESGAIALDWFAKALTDRTKGELDVSYHGGTLLTKEIDIMNAVKAGNIAMGNPGGASATLFPEMGVFLVGYLINSYQQAYTILNGKVGDDLDRTFQQKYGVKVMLLLRLRVPACLECQAGDQRAEGSAGAENPRPAVEGFRRYRSTAWARWRCRLDGPR